MEREWEAGEREIAREVEERWMDGEGVGEAGNMEIGREQIEGGREGE